MIIFLYLKFGKDSPIHGQKVHHLLKVIKDTTSLPMRMDTYIYPVCFMTLGISFDTVTLNSPSDGFDPMYIIKFDSSGKSLWGKALASGGDDKNGIALGNNNSLYVAGDFYNVNPFVIGCDTLDRTATENIFIAKLSSISCSAQQDSIVHCDDYFKLFPNPFQEILNITFNCNETRKFTLYDILSRELFSSTVDGSTSLILDYIANGMYIYQITDKNGVIKSGKLIKN
jgi:hypothetical protein